MKLQYALLFINLIAILGCSSDNGSNRSADQISYFDLDQYLQKKLLGDCSNDFVKFIQFDQSTDSGRIKKDEIVSDLSFLKRYNINSSSHYGDYDVDTVLDQHLMTITYRSNKKSSSVREMRVGKNGEQVRQLHFEVIRKTLLREEKLALEVDGCHINLQRETTSLFGKSEIIGLEFYPMLE